jgi:hypothetical protein
MVRAVAKTAFNASPLAAGQNTETVFAEAINVTQYKKATLLVKVHSVNISIGGSGSFVINVYGEDPTLEDPPTSFATSALASATIDNSTSAPLLIAKTIPLSGTTVAPYLRVTVAQMGGSAAFIVATLSADLSLKS